MKKIQAFVVIMFTFAELFAQVPSTDIFIVNITAKEGSYEFGKPVNITNRPGYDNQPSFTADGKRILYASMHDTIQTDIYLYNLKDSTTSQLTNTSESEYSPVMMPDEKHITCVRVDADKAQRLYNIDLNYDEDPYQVVNSQDSVAYYGWIDTSNVACAMLNGNKMDLEIFDISSQQFVKLMSGVGRCMMNIPGTDEFSFTLKTSDSTAAIYRFNNKTGDMMPLCELPVNCEDYAFNPDGKIITGKDGKLLMYDASMEKADWKEIADFSKTVGNFYRLAISPKGNRMALVSFRGKKP